MIIIVKTSSFPRAFAFAIRLLFTLRRDIKGAWCASTLNKLYFLMYLDEVIRDAILWNDFLNLIANEKENLLNIRGVFIIT